MAKMAPLPTNKYLLLLAIIIGHSLLGGYYAGTRPEGAGWRFFSWHPFLMMVGTSNVSLFPVMYYLITRCIYLMHLLLRCSVNARCIVLNNAGQSKKREWMIVYFYIHNDRSSAISLHFSTLFHIIYSHSWFYQKGRVIVCVLLVCG